jgi:hypothetical protein
MENEPAVPPIVDRSTFHAELDALRVREKAHTREGDAIAAARRRLPMGRGACLHTAYRRARPGHAVGRVRGTPAAHCLLPHVAPVGTVRQVLRYATSEYTSLLGRP